MKKRKAKPIFREDCTFFASLINHQKIVGYRCLAYSGHIDVEIFSCGKDCPFYERDEKTMGKEP